MGMPAEKPTGFVATFHPYRLLSHFHLVEVVRPSQCFWGYPIARAVPFRFL